MKIDLTDPAALKAPRSFDVYLLALLSAVALFAVYGAMVVTHLA